MSVVRPFVSVRNTGPAVPPREVSRLFLPFQRLGPGRAGPADGHGLGLAAPGPRSPRA